ncbi:hypothetical protein TrVE_jg1805 [Triparma verrucosa]|uniref:PH domain-containing protein n=1 Tax=Triparma verrucosa TaxID=1606542 RepID=A0A9W7C5L2_9STRA|nr:hypothetical protein TrVE_jg1805 [Triparma verrucosa]
MVAASFAGVDISQLEGWLEKDRQSKNVGLFKASKQKRYFKVHCINQTSSAKGDMAELAMCYYKARGSKDPNGWFFLKDVTNIEESQHKITISHPVRTFVLTAPTRAEHTIWITGLIKICKHARIIRDGEVVNLPGQDEEVREENNFPEDDPRRWSKEEEDYDSDEFRRGPKSKEVRETAESRALRAKKRQQRREERNRTRRAQEQEEGDHRSDGYRMGGEGDMANARVARTIRGDEEEEEEEGQDQPYRGEYRGENREDREPDYEPEIRKQESRESRYDEDEEKTEETMEEDEKEEEEEEEEAKGGEEEAESRKEGQFKFGTGLGPKPEFQGKELEKTPKLLKSSKINANGPEYDSDDARKINMGETMDEMTLGDGERNGRRLSGANSRAFGVDTPAKGALSTSRGSNRSEEKDGSEGEEEEEEAKFDTSPKEKRTAADDEEFWGVNAGNEDDSILGDRSYSNGVSFRFDSDSDDEEVDLSMEREKRRQAVLEAEREEELRRREEAKGMDEDDEIEAEMMEADKKKKKKDKKRTSKIGAPPSGPPPGKIKMKPPSMAPPSIASTGLTPDKNFVEENWDEDSPSPIKSKVKARTRQAEEEKQELGGVKADANFVEEDWD